jgi:membrane protease YdiL (CAAX protease family)
VNETRRARRSTYGLLDVLLGLGVAIVASGIAASIALGATGDEELDDVPMWLYAVVQAAQWIGLIGVPILLSKRRGGGPVRDFGAWMTRRDVPFGLALGVALQLVMVPLISLPWVLLLGKDTNELDDRAKELTDRAHGFGLFVLTLVVVVGAPFAEELFFRGLTLQAFTRRVGVVGGIVGSALVFAATHLDLLSFPALAVFGIVMGVLVHRSGRLGPAWWAHVGFNATTIAILVLQR